MLATVYLNNKFFLMTHEIYDIRSGWVLTAELVPSQLTISKMLPQQPLGISHMFS